MNNQGKILAVVGAQYGSEGKGVVINYLANQYDVHIRVGGPNAGHSFVHEGKIYKMQVIPCGWTNPRAKIIIGRGALVNPKLFIQELELIEKVYPDVKNRIFVDFKTGILDTQFADEEGHTHGELHKRIGSTGEGVGVARVARIRRDPINFRQAKDTLPHEGFEGLLTDTVTLIHNEIKKGTNILLEGAQGAGLSLIHGDYPYVTSHDTNAAQMAADIGIPPQLITDVLLVARTYPIRVAGNSGGLKNEITWDEMSKRIGKPVLEKTTVTRKIRRIGEWDDELFNQAVMLNAPTSVALMFADYLNPKDEGVNWILDLSDETFDLINHIEKTWNIKVDYVGTGGYTINGNFNLATY